MPVDDARETRDEPGSGGGQLTPEGDSALTGMVAVCRAVAETAEDVHTVCEITAAGMVLAMRRPEVAVASVQLAGHVHETGELPAPGSQLSVPVLVAGHERGRIDVGYTHGGADFLRKERYLLEAVATTLALWLEQRESSEALAESEARFRRLVTNIPDVVFRYRLGADEALEYVSPSVKTLTGFTDEELLADPALLGGMLGSNGEPPAIPGLGEAHSGAGTVTAIPLVQITARDGSARWAEFNTVDVYDENGTIVGVEGVARDVTDRVAASDAVRQREREQAVLAQVGQAALLTHGFDDLFDLAADLLRTTLSMDATALYEVSPEGLDVEVTNSAGWPTSVVGTRLGLEECSLTAATLVGDAPVVVPDIAEDAVLAAPLLAAHGLVSALTVVVGGPEKAWGVLGGYTRNRREYSDDEVQFLQTLAHILGAAVNRTHTEAALADSEAEFRTLANNLPDIVARFDRKLRHLYVNPRVESTLGLSPGELIGKTNRERFGPTPALELWEDTAERVFGSGEPATMEVAYPLAEGTVFLHTLVIPEFDSDGAVRTVLAVTRDISGMRQAEAQRREGLARIVAAQEEERARIGGDIHDDSIQVMTAVGMRLDGLRRQVTDPDSMAQLGLLEEAVRHSINRLRSLMFELRPPELDRDGLATALRLYLGATSNQSLPLGEVVDNCSTDLPPDMRTVLYRIALEAITNARKHAGAARLEIALDDLDDGIRLQVRDDGRGFDTAELTHLGPHHLGTTTMRQRAEVAGGSLHIRSGHRQGTVVTAWLPSPPVTTDQP